MTKGFYPAAKVLNIPPGANDPAIKPRLAILHVDAGNASSLYTFFRDRSGGIESHFFVRADGVVEQYRSIYFQADANLDANDFAVSIETQGYGAGTWNDKQIAAIKALLLWLHQEAGIPLQKVAKWDGSGVGYHTLFGAPSHWTPVAKTCPGPGRVSQFNDVLVPWFRTALAPAKKPAPAVTNVSKGRDLIKQGLAAIAKAKKRPRAQKQAAIIKDALKAMPAS